MYSSGVNAGQGPAWVGVSATAALGSALLELLMADDIVPGTPPGYQLCKTIYSYHPLGAILADAPVVRAQALPRQIDVPVVGEKKIVAQFQDTWDTIGRVGATVLLHNLASIARIYGIGSIGVGERGKDPSKPLDLGVLDKSELYFNIFDPLNTAGSLVLNQDPHSPDFLKPAGTIRVSGQPWHTSRAHVKMHEQALYIDWTTSAFGFVGRSVYQRGLFPLKTFVQSMITDQMVTQKAGLLVAKMKTPGSLINNVMQTMFGWKRGQIKAGVTGQVLQIGETESVETLNMINLDKAAGFSRINCIKNIATAVGMPASIIAQETLTEGFGEGTEDAKKEAAYLDYIRQDMQAAYDFMDRIVQRVAWTPEFYEIMRSEYSDYADVEYETAFHDWTRAFAPSWPNLLVEPDSEKSKTADVQFKAVVALVETLGPLLDPVNKAELLSWAAENANEREELFSSKFIVDTEALEEYLEENRQAAQEVKSEETENREPNVRPFSAAS